MKLIILCRVYVRFTFSGLPSQPSSPYPSASDILHVSKIKKRHNNMNIPRYTSSGLLLLAHVLFGIFVVRLVIYFLWFLSFPPSSLRMPSYIIRILHFLRFFVLLFGSSPTILFLKRARWFSRRIPYEL